jgi:hypothetical protein
VYNFIRVGKSLLLRVPFSPKSSEDVHPSSSFELCCGVSTPLHPGKTRSITINTSRTHIFVLISYSLFYMPLVSNNPAKLEFAITSE